MSKAEQINAALWEEAMAYHKYGVYPDLISAWQSAFRCWLRFQLEAMNRQFYENNPDTGSPAP